MTACGLPNLFVIGAPKCGTTSLFYWLSAHPDVCGSSSKETYYLLDRDYPMGPDGIDKFYRSGLDGYGNYFRDCHDERYRLEATPDYLYQQMALDVISHMEKPRVLVVLRKPSERVYSLYQFARNNGGILDMDISFRDFVASIRHDTALLSRKPILRRAIEQSQYVDYLKRWVSAIGRDNIHIIVFEDIVRQPLSCMRTLSDSLGIDPLFYEDFDFVAHNKTASVKSKMLHRIRKRVHSVLSRHFAKLIPARIKLLAHSAYDAINQSPEKNIRTREEEEIIDELDVYFSSYNQELEELLDIDLSGWKV